VHHSAVVSYSLQQRKRRAINQDKLCCHKIQQASNINGDWGLVKCKSDHSYYSHHAPLTASQLLQAHKENALTERALWNRRARLVTSTVF